MPVLRRWIVLFDWNVRKEIVLNTWELLFWLAEIAAIWISPLQIVRTLGSFCEHISPAAGNKSNEFSRAIIEQLNYSF